MWFLVSPSFSLILQISLNKTVFSDKKWRFLMRRETDMYVQCPFTVRWDKSHLQQLRLRPPDNVGTIMLLDDTWAVSFLLPSDKFKNFLYISSCSGTIGQSITCVFFGGRWLSKLTSVLRRLKNIGLRILWSDVTMVEVLESTDVPAWDVDDKFVRVPSSNSSNFLKSNFLLGWTKSISVHSSLILFCKGVPRN